MISVSRHSRATAMSLSPVNSVTTGRKTLRSVGFLLSYSVTTDPSNRFAAYLPMRPRTQVSPKTV